MDVLIQTLYPFVGLDGFVGELPMPEEPQEQDGITPTLVHVIIMIYVDLYIIFIIGTVYQFWVVISGT